MKIGIAIFISLILHILCLDNVNFTFAKRENKDNSTYDKILFLGSILEGSEYSLRLAANRNNLTPSESTDSTSLLYSRFIAPLLLKVDVSSVYGSVPEPKGLIKPFLANFADNKIVYFTPVSGLLRKTDKADSSIMFFPKMPYHFLLYFKDRQTAYMEVAFYVSPEGKIMKLEKRISSGNPEVDLLIMRNLAHFLNISKSNFTLDSWRTVKIDLKP